MRIEPIELSAVCTRYIIVRGRGRNERAYVRGGGWTSKIVFKAACWETRNDAQMTLDAIRARGIK